ncbi:MAG: hypothetical protein K9H48_20485 [Melioribacteraceae bacterium]|nr:hypothetical protein [Melioribacteraceae bacterium]
MLYSNTRFVRKVKYSNSFKKSIYTAHLIFIASCSSDYTIQHEALLTEKRDYSLVFIIHGDGGYFYHDTNGNEYKADEVTLEKAKRIAGQNLNAEVFIFHQKPKRNFLLFFPLKDGEFYYYRNGQLIANEKYWRDQEESNFDFEVDIYCSLHAGNQYEMMKMFLYFGHEIPELGGTGYDASYPNREFTVHNLANGLKDFTGDSTRFDLVILSTCFGGTPYTIGTLASYARYIIASPENLHLSYFDINLLERLDLNLSDTDIHTFAKKFANKTFERLSNEVQTEVSVAVYDVDRAQDFLNSVHNIYESSLKTLRGEGRVNPAGVEHCDCADLVDYASPTISDGVDIFYRPARFGRLKHKQKHSGWQCWKKID